MEHRKYPSKLNNRGLTLIELIKIENTQWSQHSQVIFTMTFVKKKRNIYDFIFSGNVSAECTEETYALVKSWLPESVRMPKVKF